MAATGSKAPLVSVQIWPRCTARRKIIVRCGVIGVDAAKEALYARLKIIEAGAGFQWSISTTWDTSTTHRRDEPYTVQQGVRPSRVDQEGRRAERGVGCTLLCVCSSAIDLNKQAEQIEAMVAAKAPGEDSQGEQQPVVPNRREREPWIDRRDWFSR